MMKRIIRIISKGIICFITALATLIISWLCYYNVRYSYAMKLEYNQEVFEYKDSVVAHLIAVTVFLIIVWAVHDLSKYIKSRLNFRGGAGLVLFQS